MSGVNNLEKAVKLFDKKPERVAAWLLRRFASVSRPHEQWNGLLYRDPEAFSIIWDALRGLDSELTELRYYSIGSYQPIGYRFTRNEASDFEPSTDAELPEPGTDWTLIVSDIDRDSGTSPIDSTERKLASPGLRFSIEG